MASESQQHKWLIIELPEMLLNDADEGANRPS